MAALEIDISWESQLAAPSQPLQGSNHLETAGGNHLERAGGNRWGRAGAALVTRTARHTVSSAACGAECSSMVAGVMQ